MSLITCPECSGIVSDKAYSCPHCGFPMQGGDSMPIKRKSPRKRRPNGSGTIVRLKGNRKNPYQVRVRTRLDDRGYPTYDVLGSYPDQISADLALAEYNRDPYDPANRQKTFAEVFREWYKWKYGNDCEDKSKTSTQRCNIAAFKNCEIFHDRPMAHIPGSELQAVLDRPDLSYSSVMHIKNLFNQMYRYALQYSIVPDNKAAYARVRKPDDRQNGVPFSADELAKLWANKDKPFVDTILILCYSGFRINELARMPLDKIDLEARTFTGGSKTKQGKNRTVPIHSKIYAMVAARKDPRFKSLLYHDETKNITERRYRECFRDALTSCGITSEHTPHDCRHTCNTLLDAAGAERVCRYKILGHTGTDINEKVYTHKTVEQLRAELEKI